MFGTVLLLVAGATSTTLIVRALSVRPMVALGDISYSWYLWHWPLIVLATATWSDSVIVKLLAALGSLIVAWIAYRVVELPIRFRQVTTRFATLRLAAVCVLIPLTLAVGLLAASNRYWGDPQVEVLAVQGGVDGWTGKWRGCFLNQSDRGTHALRLHVR